MQTCTHFNIISLRFLFQCHGDAPFTCVILKKHLGSSFPLVVRHFMQHWVLLIASHLVRSVIESTYSDQLKVELQNLRVEVHRTKELLDSYNLVLEGCERETAWLKLSGQALASLNIFLGLIGICLYLIRWRGLQTHESLVLSELPRTISDRVPVSQRVGPGRPSDFARRNTVA